MDIYKNIRIQNIRLSNLNIKYPTKKLRKSKNRVNDTINSNIFIISS